MNSHVLFNNFQS